MKTRSDPPNSTFVAIIILLFFLRFVSFLFFFFFFGVKNRDGDRFGIFKKDPV